ncbi:unnamed protein product, partial [Effrenium voratum]
MRRAAARWSSWVETRAGPLSGISLVSSSPALVWCHGLGGSVASDELRGIGDILTLDGRRTVLRLDLRGHGRSAAAHENDEGGRSSQSPETCRAIPPLGRRQTPT